MISDTPKTVCGLRCLGRKQNVDPVSQSVGQSVVLLVVVYSSSTQSKVRPVGRPTSLRGAESTARLNTSRLPPRPHGQSNAPREDNATMRLKNPPRTPVLTLR